MTMLLCILWYDKLTEGLEVLRNVYYWNMPTCVMGDCKRLSRSPAQKPSKEQGCVNRDYDAMRVTPWFLVLRSEESAVSQIVCFADCSCLQHVTLTAFIFEWNILWRHSINNSPTVKSLRAWSR